jgi:quercetin dioxygenase-like cupin family protein/ketosteroid isomerase-like protein
MIGASSKGGAVMKRLVRLGVAICIAFQFAPVALAQDPAKVGPNIYKCILENERVRVCEIRFRPGDRIPVHSHPDHFVYITAPGKLRITAVGGQPAEIDFKAGQIAWIPAEAHSAMNTGTTEVRALVVELKDIGPVEAALIQMQRVMADAIVKGDMATFNRIVAPDWILTAPNGMVQTREEAMADLRSGALKFESMVPSDLKVRVYGDTAVVTGRTTDKVSYKGTDLSGDYRFTDVFVNRDGRWQLVSTQVTRVMPQ